MTLIKTNGKWVESFFPDGEYLPALGLRLVKGSDQIPEELPGESPGYRRPSRSQGFSLKGDLEKLAHELWDRFRDLSLVEEALIRKGLNEDQREMVLNYLRLLDYVHKAYIKGGPWGLFRAVSEEELSETEYGITVADKASRGSRNLAELAPLSDEWEPGDVEEPNFAHFKWVRDRNLKFYNRALERIDGAKSPKELYFLGNLFKQLHQGLKEVVVNGQKVRAKVVQPPFTWEQYWEIQYALTERYWSFDQKKYTGKALEEQRQKRWKFWDSEKGRELTRKLAELKDGKAAAEGLQAFFNWVGR
jgi:hypothetical protein